MSVRLPSLLARNRSITVRPNPAAVRMTPLGGFRPEVPPVTHRIRTLSLFCSFWLFGRLRVVNDSIGRTRESEQRKPICPARNRRPIHVIILDIAHSDRSKTGLRFLILRVCSSSRLPRRSISRKLRTALKHQQLGPGTTSAKASIGSSVMRPSFGHSARADSIPKAAVS